MKGIKFLLRLLKKTLVEEEIEEVMLTVGLEGIGLEDVSIQTLY